MSPLRRLAASGALLSLAACYRPAVEMPSYEPRAVAVPAQCEELTKRAATAGTADISEADFRMLTFCQHQQLLRAAEEDAVARRMDAHARAAGVFLQAATIVIGATIAVLSWVF